MPAGEEKVGQLRHQLPQRDPEPASLPEAPTGQQLEVLETRWPWLGPGTCSSGTCGLWTAPAFPSGREGLSPAQRSPVSCPPCPALPTPSPALAETPGLRRRCAALPWTRKPAKVSGACSEVASVSPAPHKTCHPLQDRA